MTDDATPPTREGTVRYAGAGSTVGRAPAPAHPPLDPVPRAAPGEPRRAPLPARMPLDAFLEGCPEDGRFEWARGEVVAHLPSSARHQALVFFLGHLLGLFVTFFRRGRAFAAPLLVVP